MLADNFQVKWTQNRLVRNLSNTISSYQYDYQQDLNQKLQFDPVAPVRGVMVACLLTSGRFQESQESQ